MPHTDYPAHVLDAVAGAIGDVVVQDLEAELPTYEARKVEARAALDAIVELTGGHEHVARFFPDDFTLQHPITERLDGTLFDCHVHQHLAALPAPPALGDYRIWMHLGALRWEPITDPEGTTR